MIVSTIRKRTYLCFVLASMLFLLGISSREALAQPYLNLPEEPVTMVVYDGTPISYFLITLSNVPAGYDVTNGTYFGWCIEEYIFLTLGEEYTVSLYSSYDPDLPAYLQDDDWDMVNYILNHKQGDAIAIQQAIWYFVNGGNMPSSPEGQAMVNDAKNNGEGFIPEPGQVIAVICDTDGGDDHPQHTIIEVERPLLVGGEILSVNALELVAPFLLPSLSIIAGIIAVLFKRSFFKQNRC